MTNNPEVVKVSIWSWVRWTVFPFVSLKRHVETMDAFERMVDESDAVNVLLAEQVAAHLDYIDSLEMQLADKGFEPSKPARVVLDNDDEALSRMDNDGYIDPTVWGHPVKD